MTNFMFYAIVPLVLCYLIYMVYKMVRPEFSRVTAVPARPLTPEERTILETALHSNDAHEDSADNIYSVTGKVYTALPVRGAPGVWGTLYDFKIGKYEFSHDRMASNAMHTENTLHDGMIATVLFSPRTKYVWNISPAQSSGIES